MSKLIIVKMFVSVGIMMIKKALFFLSTCIGLHATSPNLIKPGAPLKVEVLNNASRCSFGYNSLENVRGWGKASAAYPSQDRAAFYQGKDVTIAAVFDGHGKDGDRIAEYLQANLLDHICCELLLNHKEDICISATGERDPYVYKNNILGHIKYGIEKAFEDVTKKMKDKDSPVQKYLQYSGSTGTMLIVVGNFVFTANVGDSRIVGSFEGDCKDLTVDQKPHDKKERQRLVDAGHAVFSGRVGGQLGVARVFGDLAVFEQGKKLFSTFNSAEPEVTLHGKLQKNDFLIIASDGLWDVISSEDAVKFVQSRLADGQKLCDISKTLATKARLNKNGHVSSADDITVLIVRKN